MHIVILQYMRNIPKHCYNKNAEVQDFIIPLHAERKIPCDVYITCKSPQRGRTTLTEQLKGS